MDEAIRQIERNDGIRLTWNVWGTKGEETSKVPLACMYNIHQKTGLLECEPIFCSSCKSVLNYYCSIDYGRQSWLCVICNASNGLPSHARDITPDNLLPELSEENSTIEYVLSKEAVFCPVFFFVVDICTFDEERHNLLKKALRTTFDKIPDECLVGFIKFGTNLELLEINSSKPNKIYLFSGKTEYNTTVVGSLDMTGKGAAALIGRFLLRKYECKEQILNIINTLERDPFPVLNAYKPIRATGSALSLAVSLLENTFTAVKYLLFTQGPCTFGPGTVTSIKYKEKGKNDFVPEDGSTYETSALKFYTHLGGRMADVGHSVDILSCTIEDIGIKFMERLTSITGGMLIMAQDFDENIYVTSCSKIMSNVDEGYINSNNSNVDEGSNINNNNNSNYINNYNYNTNKPLLLQQGFCAKLVVKTSPNLKYNGVLGMGKSSSTGWRLGSIFPSTNLTLLLETSKEASHQDFGYVQIITQYQRSDRKIILRVTTFARMFSDTKEEVINGFDQEAVAVFQARFLLMKKYEEVKDCERMIDKNLIRFTKSFGKFTKGHASSLILPESMAYYPNFMFFFKRSLLVQTENVSVDESVYFKNLLYREKVDDALKLIKPTLISYNYETGVSPVELDSKSLQPDVILVLDTFHNVVVWRGGYVALWIKEGYHKQEEYVSLKEIIEESEGLARDLCRRVPTPQFCITEENKSQQRILHHYVNPSCSGTVITENISFDKFFDALSKVVVSSEE